MEEPEIRTLSSKIVYQNRWMRVREDAIERPDGSKGIYGVVEKPDFAVIIPWDRGGLHLVEQHRYPVGARYWELPQGSWEGTAIEALVAAGTIRDATTVAALGLWRLKR